MAEQESNGRIKVHLRDAVQIIILLCTIVTFYFGVVGRIDRVEAWAMPPDGRIVRLEGEMSRHVLVVEAEQEKRMQECHDTVTRLETKLDVLTKQLEKQNAAMEKMLDLLGKKALGPIR